MTTLNYILQKFNTPNPTGKMPIEIQGFGRNDLAKLFAELDFKTGAEIGVEQGLYTEVLCKANPQAKIYAIDAWEAYPGYREHVSQEKLDGFERKTVERLKPYNCQIIRKFSDEAGEQFKPGSLDFVYIDANHDFVHVVNDIAEWSEAVRVGGIIAGHDYRKDKGRSSFHVMQAVGGFTSAYHIAPWFVLRGDKSASFMWVKS